MKTKSNNTHSHNERRSTQVPNNKVSSTKLKRLFEDELKDMYWAEKALVTAIPKMIKNATAPDLIAALRSHLAETEVHVTRVEEVFQLLDKKVTAKKCEAIAGLIKEAQQIMKECEEGAMRDAGIISAAQKVEHYEIASYGTLCQFAQTLDIFDAVNLLEQTLQEEKDADEKLSEVALDVVNLEAASEISSL